MADISAANKVLEMDVIGIDYKPLEVEFGGHSTAGIKGQNQDAFAAWQPEPPVRMLKGCVAAVADGVSCSERSAEASQVSVTDFISDYYSTPDTWSVKESASRVLNALNSWLYQNGIQGGSRRSELVTTFSCAVFKSNTAHIFHIGDSRIYRYRKSTLELLTRGHYRREAGDKDMLTRAMGMDIHLEVDYLQDEPEAGDIYLLTTDGVHDFLSDRELKVLLAKDSPSLSLEAQAQRIVNHALSQGSDDNLSCLLVKVKHLPQADVDEVHRRLAHYVVPPVMQPGQSIDGYRVLEILHSSTRSHLYLVQSPDGPERRVLKAPSQNFAQDPHYLEAFIREQWVGQRVQQQNVMKVYPRPADTRLLYNLYEYIPAQELRQWMLDNPRPTIGQVRGIIEQIAAALRAFQRLSMVHRDLKPENILVNQDGIVKLIDFGTVQVSGLQEIQSPLSEECPVGSLNYIAPEYLMGQPGAFRSDIFSLGVIAYEMLCGELPYKQPLYRNQIPKYYSHWQYRPISREREDIPLWLDLTLKKAAAPAPQDRYPVLSEFMQDLGTPNQQMLNQYQQPPLLERNPVLFWKLLSGLLLALLFWQLTH